MEDLNREGRTRAIGLSNFYPDRLADLITHNEIVPAVNQIETHVFFQRTADHRLMREHGIQHESPSPTTRPSPRTPCAGSSSRRPSPPRSRCALNA